jgi:hypothetical protein
VAVGTPANAEEVVDFFVEAGQTAKEGREMAAELRTMQLPPEFPEEKRPAALLLLGKLADQIEAMCNTFEEMAVVLTKPA